MTTPRNPDPRAAELLSETILGQLSFLGLDGYPRVVPVWFDITDGEILISNAPGTYKCAPGSGRGPTPAPPGQWESVRCGSSCHIHHWYGGV